MPRAPDAPGSRLVRLAIPIGLLLVFALLCGTSLTRKSGTWDEYLIGIGLRRDLPDARFHPPLSSVIHSLPLRFVEIPERIWEDPNGPRRGQRIVDLRDDDRILDAARLALLPLAVALGALVFVWGRRLYGFWGGALPLALYAFDPNVIAHARLITPDATLAATSTLCLYRLARLGEAGGARNRLLAGLALGLLLLSKYTALLLAALFFVAHVAACVRSRLDRRGALRAALADAAAVSAVGLALVWLAYGLSWGPVSLGEGLALPLPAPDYASGVVHQWRQSRMPHDLFLLGRHSTDGWWYFYLVVLALKVPLGTLLLLGLALAGRRRLGVAARSEEIYLWLPALLFAVYLSLLSTLHNGFRYLLPVWPGLLVLTGRLAGPALRAPAFRALLAVPVAWVAVAAVWIWPDYLAYGNELMGGPGNGVRVFSDSNLDWGQDLEGLADWMRDHDVERIQLAYFGTADPRHWGIDYVALPSPTSALPPTPPPGPDPPRVVALSAYQYQGVGFGGENPYARFHALRPNAVVGHSILIFDLDDPLPRAPAASAR